MSGLRNLDDWQYANVERAMNLAVREALFYGVDADELRKLLAACWGNELRERAELGARAILECPR